MAIPTPLVLSTCFARDNNTTTVDIDYVNARHTTDIETFEFNGTNATNGAVAAVVIADTVAMPVHTLGLRHQLQFYRTYPKRSGVSHGAKKTAIKLTRDVSVPDTSDGTNVLPQIFDLSASVPVGTSEALVKDQISILIALLQDETVINELVNKLRF